VHLFYQPQLRNGINLLDGDDAHHAKVLRLSSGDNILVTDGKGLLCEAVITSGLNFKIQKTINTQPPIPIHLYVAPTKSADRIEWLVEKATEIGVTSITLAECTRSERRKFGHDRLVKVAISAMKQSQQSWLPEIKPLTPFTEILKHKSDQNFIAYVDHTNPDQLKNLAKAGKSYSLLIGPEGDFTDEEIDLALKNGWQKVSLGPNRLRTETAALTGVLTLMLVNN
jgi:16S rRNA (uracil1498-N3)-methyltransferase